MKKGQAVGVDDIPSKFLMDRGGGSRMVNINFQRKYR